MTAIPKKTHTRLTREHQQQFVTTMLPTITRVARQTFSDLDPEAKEEATAEVVATAFIMFVGLVRDGRKPLAYPSVLAMYGVRRVRIGRQAAAPRTHGRVTFNFWIDFEDWLNGLPRRERPISERLAVGDRPGQVARRFGLSPSRISQLCRQLWHGGQRFEGKHALTDNSTTAVTSTNPGGSSCPLQHL